MDTNQMPIPIELRTHERAQLEDFVPRLRAKLEEAERDDLLDTLDAVDLEAEEVTDNGETIEAPFNTVEQWRTLIKELHRLKAEEGLRQWWLRRKLYHRLRKRVEELEGDE